MRSWPLLVLAAQAAAEVWSGRVGIAAKTGFGRVPLLSGLWPSLHLDTAITLPVGVEAYAAYALRAWLASGQAVSLPARRFAKWSAICSFALGMAGQVAYHLLAQAGTTRAPWAITTIVSCLPVLVLGMGTTLAHMLHADADTPDSQATGPAILRSPARSPQDQAGTGPGPSRGQADGDRVTSPTQDQNVRAPGPWRDRQDRRASRTGRATADEPGPAHRLPTCRRRQASITAIAAQRRSQGLQPRP